MLVRSELARGQDGTCDCGDGSGVSQCLNTTIAVGSGERVSVIDDTTQILQSTAYHLSE
jgi:hypothetical protein